MLRKQLLGLPPDAPAAAAGQKDIASIATVLMTSEVADHPIENLFDGRGGPGGSRWVAAEPGEQTVVLAFDTPQTIRTIGLEVEEREAGRTQELQVAVSRDGGRTYEELIRQEYTFSPSGATFERERWSVSVDGITHLRLVIKPDKGDRTRRATLTSLVVR